MKLFPCIFLILLCLTGMAFAVTSEQDAEARQELEHLLHDYGIEMPAELPATYASWSEFLEFYRYEYLPRCGSGDALSCGTKLIMDPLWSESVKSELDRFLAQPLQGKVVVFDADNTLWYGDAERSFVKALESTSGLPSVRPDLDGTKRKFLGEYASLRGQSRSHAAEYAVRLLAGQLETDVRNFAGYFARTYIKPFIFTSQRNLIRRLNAAGADVWVVTSLNQWLAEASVAELGIAADHVIGSRVEVLEGRLTTKLVEPVPSERGKAHAVMVKIGKRPVLVAGDGPDDFDMLSLASQLKLVIRANPETPYAWMSADPLTQQLFIEQQQLYEQAQEKGWLIQTW